MKKFVVWVLATVLAIVPTTPAFAEEQRGRAFFDPGTDISTPEKYAQEIEKCASNNTRGRATCDMLVESFNRAFDDIDDVEDYKELADYFRNETRVVPCPQVMTRIARVVGDKVDLEWQRTLNEGERCFYDDNAQRYVSSAGCGQWIPDKHPIFTANSETPSLTDQANSLAGAAGSEAGRSRESDDQDSFMSEWSGKKVAKVAGSVAAGAALLWLLSKVLGAKQEVTVNTCVGPNCR